MTATAGAVVALSPYCLAATELGIEEAHERCAATRPRYLPGVHAAVLPAVPCGCACHSNKAAQ